MIKTNFLGDEIPKENVHYICIACITIDSVMKIEKKVLPTSLFRRMQIQIKENKNDQIQKAGLESDSESELESDTELE